MKHIFPTVFVFCLVLLPIAGLTQDRIFTYTYQSNVLPKGQKELEVWNTFHVGRADYYRALRHRVEYEIGLGGRLQTAFYLNLSTGAAYDPSSETIQALPAEFWFSNEWKWKLLDPLANPVGLALYGEIGVAARELDLEAKIILDKQIGKTLHAFNAVFEPEWESEAEKGEVESEFELQFELDYAFSWRLNRNWNVGFEVRDHNAWKPQDGGNGGWEYSALFAGPGLSYNADRFWLNLTIMPQIAGLRHPEGQSGGLILNEHERLETRLIFSYAF